MSDVDQCGAGLCLNGATCIDGDNSYSCNCPNGYSGTHCEKGMVNLQQNTRPVDSQYGQNFWTKYTFLHIGQKKEKHPDLSENWPIMLGSKTENLSISHNGAFFSVLIRSTWNLPRNRNQHFENLNLKWIKFDLGRFPKFQCICQIWEFVRWLVQELRQ